MLLESMALVLEDREINDMDAVLRELSKFKETYDFANMGVLDSSHMLHMLGNMKHDIADTDFVRQVWDDECHITESYPAYDGGKYMVNAFSCPVYRDGEIQCILLATYHSKKFIERMNISSMEGKGYTFLLNTQGEVVIHPQYYEDEAYNALMEYINDVPEIIPDQSGDSSFEYNGESYYAHFEELGFNNWFLMTCARESDVFSDASIIMRMVFMAVGVLWGLIFLTFCATIASIYSNRQKRIQSEFYDDLLNIGNANALEVCYNHLPENFLDNMYAVVFDIDKLKEFNYLYGSDEGDHLLQYIVRTVLDEFPKVLLFRYESDCFVALHPFEDPEVFEPRLQHLDDRVDEEVRKGIIQPFEISAGVRMVKAGESMRLVISDAMIARETIKGNYLRHFAVYDGAVRDQRLIDMEMESDFTAALEKKEFHVFYQPKCDIRTGCIVGAEALTRWIKDDGTVVSPGAFIHCFEKSLQVIMLDEMVLTEVCRQMKQMELDGLKVVPVSVNLSRVHLRYPGVLGKIEGIIKNSEINPANLSFEVTESALLEESIPIKDIIRSTTQLTKQWGLECLAEGVEEKYQADRLIELGCTYAQGFYYSRPVPESDYRVLLAKSVLR